MTAPTPRQKPDPATYCFDSIVLDLVRGSLMREGEEVKLRPKSYELLRYFVENNGRLLTKDELMKAVWPDSFVIDDSLVQSVKNVRRALGDEGHRYVKTVPRRGYIFEASVNVNGSAAADVLVSVETQTTQTITSTAETVSTSGDIPDVQQVSQRRSLRGWIGVGAILPLAVAGLLAFYPAAPEDVVTVDSSPEPLTSYLGWELNPALSPDGHTVAFTWNGDVQGNFDIYVQSIGSHRPQPLTTDPADDTSPAWSPDGLKIAFLRRLDSDRNQLIIIPAAGGAEHVLVETRNRIIAGTASSSIRQNLAWSRDGEWIAAPHREDNQSSAGLYLYSVSTGASRRLTQAPASYIDENPAFSPDSDALVFTRLSSAGSLGDLYLQPLSKDLRPTGEVKRLTTTRQASHPAWTRDGRLVYVHRPWGTMTFGSLRMRPSAFDQSETVLVDGQVVEFSLGRHLVYAEGGDPGTNIWRAEVPPPNAPPSAPQRFIASTRNDSRPQYSPDGREIAFLSDRSGSEQIWIANADGSNLRQLTSLKGNPKFPTWSVGGHHILFHARISDRADLYSVPVTGGEPKRLTFDESDDSLASYSRDGQWIYFTSNRSDGGQIWKMPAGGGDATRLTFTEGKTAYMPIEAPDGKTLFYAQGGSGLTIWKVPVEGGTPVPVTGPIVITDPAFAIGKDGIYYKAPSESPSQQLIQFLSFSTGNVRTVAVTEHPIGLGLSLSPDERFLIFALREGAGTDLTLIRDFDSRK